MWWPGPALSISTAPQGHTGRMRIFDRKPALRWLAPLAFVLVVGGAGGIVAVTASADPGLKPRSASQLLADLQQAKVDAMSGKIVQTSDLGIPNLPGLGGSDGTSFTSLISGTHSMGVWYSGPGKARIALYGADQGALGESDVFKNGSDVWTWSYKDKTATHRTLAQSADKTPMNQPTEIPATPQQAADRALKAIDPTTKVSVANPVKVAGRDAYELVLTPKQGGSLITQVRIAIDGQKLIPLRVQVLAGKVTAFEVGFTHVDFARPDNAQFTFTPPAGTKVTQVPAETTKKSPQAGTKGGSKNNTKNNKVAKKPRPEAANQPKVIGHGWSTIVVSKLPTGAAKDSGQLGQVLGALPTVSGSFGSGRILRGTAFTVLLTNDGRIAVGSVPSSALIKALAK
jgi:outer membrane lipoprotein-sorting protein